MTNQYSADVQTLLQVHRAACTTALRSEGSTTTSPSAAQIQTSYDAVDTINHTELACNHTVLGSRMQVCHSTKSPVCFCVTHQVQYNAVLPIKNK